MRGTQFPSMLFLYLHKCLLLAVLPMKWLWGLQYSSLILTVAHFMIFGAQNGTVSSFPVPHLKCYVTLCSQEYDHHSCKTNIDYTTVWKRSKGGGMHETAGFNVAGLGYFCPPTENLRHCVLFLLLGLNTLLTRTTMGWSCPSFHWDL